MRLTIERLGHLGDGIAEGPVFVPLTLPGEVVEGEVEGGRIDDVRIVTPSSDRVSPPCPHFRRCGGCALQHASNPFVEAWKAGVVRTALEAHGLLAPIRRVITSPPGSRRRAVLAGRRTKSGAIVGFHARGSDTLYDIPGCTLLHADILALIPALQRITEAAASRKAEVGFRITRSDAGADIDVTGAKPLDGAMRAAMGTLAAKAGIARLTWEGEIAAQHQPPILGFDGTEVVPPPGAFLQATAEGEAALTALVREAVGDAGSLVDLFAGCGTFALPLARKASVHAVEGDAAMLAALDAGWRNAAGLKRVSTEVRDLFRRPLLAAELNRYDAVVIDPPRAGAEAQMAQIAASKIARLAMVSCNPVTFARDAAALVAGGFRLDWIDVVDQFRWSPHVELAAQFSRGGTR